MKEQDAGLLKILGPLAGDALRLSGYDGNGVSVALNPVDSKIYEVRSFGRLTLSRGRLVFTGAYSATYIRRDFQFSTEH